MKHCKRYFFKIFLALFMLSPFLLEGQNKTLPFEENFQPETNDNAGFFALQARIQEEWFNVPFLDTKTPANEPNRKRWQFRFQGQTNNANMGNLESPTDPMFNIFISYNSFYDCNDPLGQDVWFISPPISPEDAETVILSFNTYYRSFNDRPQIRVGTELETKEISGIPIVAKQSVEDWDVYEVFPGIQADEFGGAVVGNPDLNPQPISIDISRSAVGKETVYIAFQFLSSPNTINGGFDPFLKIGCGYAWHVDDVRVFEPTFEEITCGESVLAGISSNSQLENLTDCSGGPSTGAGNDNLFRFEIPENEPQTVLIELKNTLETSGGANPVNLDLFLLESENNNPDCTGTIITSSKLNNTSSEELVENLAPGVYWIVVEQTGAVSTTADTISLSLNCFPNGELLQIACGETLTGTNEDENSTASAATNINDCFPGSAPANYNGGDRRYQFTVDQESTVFFELTTRGPGDVDGFLFENNNGDLGDCVPWTLNPDTETGVEELAARIAPGTYWILIDSPDKSSEANYDLALSCFPIDNSTNLFCGAAPVSSSTSGLPSLYNNSNYADCFPGNTEDYTAGDRVYQFEIEDTPQTVSLKLTDLTDQQLNFFLFSSVNGEPAACIAAGISIGPGGEYGIMETLDPGSYSVIVDGALDSSEGPFELSLNCFAAQTAEQGVISCDQPISGNSLGSANDFTGPGGTHSGGDQIYSFSLQGNPQQVLISLSSLGIGALDLFLYRAENGQPVEPPVAQSTQASLNKEAIFLTLEAGNYLVLVDGQPDQNTAFPSEGPYTLALNCFDLPTICDLEESLFIKSGNTVTSETGTAEPNNDNSFEDGIVPFKNLESIDCVESAFTNLEAVYGNIYTYFHDGNGSFKVNLPNTDPGVRALVFKCAETGRSAACMGVSENGTLEINDGAGFYNILVASENMRMPYTIQLESDNPCIPKTKEQVPYSLDKAFAVQSDVISSTLEGETNDFNRNKYKACFDISNTYNGPDKVYTFEKRKSLPKEKGIGISFRLTGVDKITAPIGLFLFNDLCEGSCVGFAELSPDEEYGAGNEIPVFELVGNFDNGIYYLVVDQAEPGAGTPFDLIFDPIRTAAPCDVNRATPHDIRFEDDLSIPTIDPDKATIFITYQRGENNKDIFFEDTKLRWDPFNPGTLNDAPVFEDNTAAGSTKKCGFQEGEKLIFYALQEDKSRLELEPEFSENSQNKENFTKGGVSRIKSLIPKTSAELAALKVDPPEVNVAATKSTREIKVYTNEDWEVVTTDPPPGWLPGLQGTSGSGNGAITLEITDNPGMQSRGYSFQVQITDPITGELVKRVVEITQKALPEMCTDNTIQITKNEDKFVNACNGSPQGATIDLTITGTVGTPLISWSHGKGTNEDASGLFPNIPYTITVSDDNDCLRSETFIIKCAPLPVECTNFSAAVKPDNQVELYWTTAQEVNNSGFEVQRSTDGRRFETIAWVNGAGTTTEPQKYIYLDRRTDGLKEVYYRLFQIDYDGTSAYACDVQAVNLRSAGAGPLQVYPNPAGEQISVQWYGKKTGNTLLRLFDQSGRLILSREWDTLEGTNLQELSIADLPRGIYELQLVDAVGQTQHARIVKE